MSNREQRRAGGVQTRTFDFQKDVTFGKITNIEDHNVCVEMNAFYPLSGIAKDPCYIVVPALPLAKQGFRFCEQDGMHVLPPGYKGPDDERGCQIDLTKTLFRVVANAEQAKILSKVMQASGLYSDRQIEAAFVAPGPNGKAAPDGLTQAKQSLDTKGETVRLQADTNGPKMVTRAFPNGDPATQYAAPAASQGFQPGKYRNLRGPV